MIIRKNYNFMRTLNTRCNCFNMNSDLRDGSDVEAHDDWFLVVQAPKAP